MKVEIVRNPTGKKKQVETIELVGSIVFPYYLNLLSMEHHPDKLVFHMLGEYTTRITYDYDREGKKPNEKLWIMGDRESDENTVNRYEA